MATNTTNYNLVKPLDGEYYDVNVPIGNMDIIDNELKKAQDHRESISNPHGVTAAQVGVSNPNLLINGGFTIWQRGTTFSMIQQYTADRWFLIDYDDTDGLNKGSCAQYNDSIKLTGGAGSQLYIKQPLEDKDYNGLLGKTVTLSVDVRVVNMTQGSVLIQVVDNVTSPYKVLSSSELTSDFKRVSLTVQIPSNGTGIAVHIGSFGGVGNGMVNSNCEIYFRNAKLEVGSVATPFVPRPYAEELAMCRRYYQRNWYILSRINVVESNKIIGLVQQEHDVEMRAVPTVILLKNRVKTIRTFDNSYISTYPTTDQITVLNYFNRYNAKMYCPLLQLGTLATGTDYIIELDDHTFGFDAEIY